MTWVPTARAIVYQLERTVLDIFQTLALPFPDPSLLISQIERLIYLNSQLQFYKAHFHQYIQKKRMLKYLTTEIQRYSLIFAQKYQILQRLDEEITSVIQSYPYSVSKDLRDIMNPIDLQPVALSLDYNNIDFSHLSNHHHRSTIEIIPHQQDDGDHSTSNSDQNHNTTINTSNNDANQHDTPNNPTTTMADTESSQKPISITTYLPVVNVNHVLSLAKRLAIYRIPPHNPFASEQPEYTLKDAIQFSLLRHSPEELIDKLAFFDE